MSAPTGSRAASFSEPRGARLRARLLVLGAAFFWGTSATLARHVFRDRHVPALTVVELRLLIAASLLAPWLAWRSPRRLVVRRDDWGYLLVLGLVGVAAVQGTYYYSISVLGVSLAILLQYLAPSLLVVFDLVRGRRVPGRMLAAVLIALVGTALLVLDPDHAARAARPLDWAIGFSSAIIFAFYVVYSKRGLERYEPPTLLLYTFLVAGAFWACVTPPWTILARGYDAGTWAMFATLGAFSTLVPFSLFYAGLRRLPATEASVLAMLEPLVAVISAAVLLGEGLRPLQWLGAPLVLGASILASRGAPQELAAAAERA